jgi:hypothetical protein
MFNTMNLGGIFPKILETSSLLANQTTMLAYAMDCMPKMNKLFPSIAYMDVIIALSYSIITIFIGMVVSIFHLFSKEAKPNFHWFVLLYSFWT